MRTFGQTFRRKFVLGFVLFACCVSAALAQNDIRLALDASGAPRNLFRVSQTMTAPPAGRLTLFYPKWIPGEHAPTGPLNDLVNLFITADGKAVEWQRDDVEMFAFHLNVPAGTKRLEVAFDYLAEHGTLATANLARIKWNRLILYPRGARSDEVVVTASMKLPADWKFATALPVRRESKNEVDFRPVNLTNFVDSPAIIGKYFAKIPLSATGPAVEMDLAAENADALRYRPETLAGWKNMVVEADRMFGARHFYSYNFLTTLSDDGGDEGLEHHQSSENGVTLHSLTNQNDLLYLSELLGHEYAHSWNGKYRRPDKLTTPDFEQPMQGELLWVYEGLTQYLGTVLPARSGLWTDEMFRETVASTAATMDSQTGRRWRPLVDTSRAVQFTYPSPRAGRNQRRGVDYYYEGSLIWMEADVLIREKSRGRLSLDDFLRKFHGGQSDGPRVKTYDLAEIVRTLGEVVAHDWQTFFIDRVYKAQPRAPLGGITGGGWQLVYNETPNLSGEVDFNRASYANLMFSLGILVNSDGAILDIDPELPAAKAGLAAGMTIEKIGDEDFSLEDLHKAVAETKERESAIRFEVENGSTSAVYTINYKGGLKYPHLVRDLAKTDYLSAITKPLGNGPASLTRVPPGFVPGSESTSWMYIPGRPRRRNISRMPQPFANVVKVVLSETEITAGCPANSNICADGKRTIEVSPEAVSNDETDVLIYNYTVSAGKIIGIGSKVVWDLSGVKPGEYTITVAADNGCGVCGTTKRETVKIVDCANCK